MIRSVSLGVIEKSCVRSRGSSRTKTDLEGERSVSGNSVEMDIEERRKLDEGFCRSSQFVRPDSDKSSQENI